MNKYEERRWKLATIDNTSKEEDKGKCISYFCPTTPDYETFPQDWVKGFKEGTTKETISGKVKEINHPDYCPHEASLSELRFKFKSKLWEFIQDPWPDPVKDFNIDEETFVLRFTYDEGCEMDKTWREWDTEDGYFMLTDEEIVKL